MKQQGPDAVVQAIQGKARIRITPHFRPDGDAVGSALGLSRILQTAGYDARVILQLPIPIRYEFLAKHNEIELAQDGWMNGVDLFITLDSGALDRLGDFAIPAFGQVATINIDHHRFNPMFADVNWVDPEASSTGEMIVQLARLAGWSLNREAAEALWVAIVTDTGRFAYENTSSQTLRIGAELVDLGVSPAVLDQQVFQSISVRELKLTERAIHSLTFHEDGRIATVILTGQDFAELDCSVDYAHDIVDIPRSIKGVEAGFFFYEIPGEDRTKVSVRSMPPHDAAELCRQFGGGGHHRAAGCSIEGSAAAVCKTVIERAQTLWYT